MARQHKIYNWGVENRHPIFLAGLVVFFILPIILEQILDFELPFQLLITVLVIASIFIMHSSPQKRYLIYGLVLSLVIFLYFWNRYQNFRYMEMAGYLFLFIYFSVITYFLFLDLFRSKKVTVNVIIGAFAGYFMIGVIFFFLYGFSDQAFPGTVNVDLTTSKGVNDMFYFSFITLTTIGYGDFSPTSTLGQRIAIVQGLIGQFYLAIVMAILVGKYLSYNQE